MLRHQKSQPFSFSLWAELRLSHKYVVHSIHMFSIYSLYSHSLLKSDPNGFLSNSLTRMGGEKEKQQRVVYPQPTCALCLFCILASCGRLCLTLVRAICCIPLRFTHMLRILQLHVATVWKPLLLFIVELQMYITLLLVIFLSFTTILT